MFAEPAIKRGSDVDSAVDERGVQCERERKKAKRDTAKGEGQGEGVEGARSESGEDERGDEQAVVVDERQKHTEQREGGGREDKYSTRAEQSAEIDGEWADEHERDIEGAADPRAVVETDAQGAFKVGGAKSSSRRPSEGDNSRAHHDAENAEERTVARAGRDRRGKVALAICHGVGACSAAVLVAIA